jgi:uncharacterized protein YciI
VGAASVPDMAVFAVTMVWGPGRDPTRSRREQADWDEHAAFMDRLVEDGTVLLGGPVGDGTDVLLAVEAADEPALRGVFAADVWHVTGVLRFGRVEPWMLWLDGRQVGTAVPREKAPNGLGPPGS